MNFHFLYIYVPCFSRLYDRLKNLRIPRFVLTVHAHTHTHTHRHTQQYSEYYMSRVECQIDMWDRWVERGGEGGESETLGRVERIERSA